MHCSMPRYVRDLSHRGFWCLQGSWNTSPADTEGPRYLRVGGVQVIHGFLTVRGLAPPTLALFKGQLSCLRGDLT